MCVNSKAHYTLQKWQHTLGIALCKLRTLVYPLNSTDVTKEGLVLLFQIFWDWTIFWQHWDLLGLSGLIYLRTYLAHTFVLFFPPVLHIKLSTIISRRYLKPRIFFPCQHNISGESKTTFLFMIPLSPLISSIINPCNFRKEKWEEFEMSCCDSMTKLFGLKSMHRHP